ncbi:J domain-containing protein [Reyranella sp.]|uniref:J domain-containing protein n=1 Tax=Reyranella sp. TaxID=1929291 RepID=UPI0040352115
MKIDVDHYLVLGVPWTADAATVRAAYVALAKRYHPDVATGNPELAAFNFRQIADAYQTLSDPDSRAGYDVKVRAALDAARVARSRVPRRAAPMPVYLPHAHAAARRRSLTVVAVVVLAFLGLGSYLATRAAKDGGSGSMLAASSLERQGSAPAEQSLKPLPPVDQPSQFGPASLPMSVPIGGVVAGRSFALRSTPAAVADGQSFCVADDGVRFALINRDGESTVIYDGVQPVRASVQFADRNLVVLTGIVPGDTITIVVQRGQEHGTYLYYANPAGAIVQTLAARCEGLAY